MKHPSEITTAVHCQPLTYLFSQKHFRVPTYITARWRSTEHHQVALWRQAFDVQAKTNDTISGSDAWSQTASETFTLGWHGSAPEPQVVEKKTKEKTFPARMAVCAKKKNAPWQCLCALPFKSAAWLAKSFGEECESWTLQMASRIDCSYCAHPQQTRIFCWQSACFADWSITNRSITDGPTATRPIVKGPFLLENILPLCKLAPTQAFSQCDSSKLALLQKVSNGVYTSWSLRGCTCAVSNSINPGNIRTN